MFGMRKWVVAGLVALAVGAGAYLLSQPRHGTVEYHEKQLLKLDNLSRFDSWVDKRGPERLQALWVRRRIKRITFHADALVKLGYLERRSFMISNSTPRNVVVKILSFSTTNINRIDSIGPDNITILGPPDQMPTWEMLIREADVREKPNVLQ